MNNQPNSLNVFLGTPILYASSPVSNFTNISQIPLHPIQQNYGGLNNIIYPVIPIILTQPNNQNKPIISSNNIRIKIFFLNLLLDKYHKFKINIFNIIFYQMKKALLIIKIFLKEKIVLKIIIKLKEI